MTISITPKHFGRDLQVGDRVKLVGYHTWPPQYYLEKPKKLTRYAESLRGTIVRNDMCRDLKDGRRIFIGQYTVKWDKRVPKDVHQLCPPYILSVATELTFPF